MKKNITLKQTDSRRIFMVLLNGSEIGEVRAYGSSYDELMASAMEQAIKLARG